jgi:hypothetical protein
MASFTLSAGRFPAGDSVGVFLADAFGRATGAAVFTGTVAADGTLVATGLADATAYVAVDGAKTARFRTPPGSPTTGAGVVSLIDMKAEGIPLDGSSDCSPFIETMKTKYPTGGTMLFPPGVFKMLSGLDLTAQPWNVEGSGQFTTTLWSGGVDANRAMIVMGPDSRIANLSLVGVLQVTVANVASAPALRGVVLRDRAEAENVRAEAFGVGVVIDGNHQTLLRVKVTNCKRNVAWAQNLSGFVTAVAASFAHGNQNVIACDFTGAGESSIYVAGDSKIDAADFVGTHLGVAPYGILLAAANGQQMALGGGTTMNGTSFEDCGVNYIGDAGWNTANRRMSKGLRFVNPKCGGLNPAYDPTGAGGDEMVKLGICQDWTIQGFVGDSSNASFGTLGWGTTATATGFRFEQCNGFRFEQADTLAAAAAAQGKPMFRWEGGLLDWSEVYFTFLNGGYQVGVFKNGSGGTLTAEKLVSGVNAANPTGTAGVKHYDASTPALGRVAANGPLTTGLMVPIVMEGRVNTPPTTDTIAIGDALTPDSANAGVKKRTLANQQDYGVALAVPSGGGVLSTCRGPWTVKM